MILSLGLAVFLFSATAKAQPTPASPVLTKPPKLLKAVPAIYPSAVTTTPLPTVDVLVQITIDAQGAVSTVNVPTTAGAEFDQAAIAAAKQFQFSPAEFDGVPGPITIETKIQIVPPPPPEQTPPGDAQPQNQAPSDAATPGIPPPTDSAAPPDATPPESGPDAVIAGTVFERGVRRKLAGAVVAIAGTDTEASTDENGDFTLPVKSGTALPLRVLASGFDRTERTIDVAPGEKISVRFYLRPTGGNPYESVVTGEAETFEVTKRTLEKRQLTTVPGTFGDPIRVIQSLPGLARSPFASGILLIRGSNPDDSGVFVDGHRIPLLFHFLGGPSILNPEFLDSIDLYPGGYPARFGRALGGIVSVSTQNTKTDGFHGAADIDLLDAGVFVRAPITKQTGIAVAGRRSYIDKLLPAFLPEQDQGSTLLVVPIYYDYQLRVDHTFADRSTLTFFGFGSKDSLKVLSEDAEDEQTLDLNSEIGFWRTIATYRRKWLGDLTLTMSPVFGRDHVAFGTGNSEDGPVYTGLSVEIDNLGYRTAITGALNKYLSLDAGIDVESRVTKYSFTVPLDLDIRGGDNIDIPPETFRRNSDTLAVGLVGDLAITLGRFRLVPGLRIDEFLIAGKSRTSVDPRFTAKVTVLDNLIAKGYAGIFHQAPQPEALDHLFGNPNLTLERAIHTGIGGEWTFADKWLADGEVYYIDRVDLVESTDDYQRDADTGKLSAVRFRNSRTSDTWGLELLIKREISKDFYGWLSYTLSRTTEYPKDRESRPSTFDQRHTLNAVASYKFAEGWELGGKLRLSTGRPFTDVAGHTFDADDGDYSRISAGFREARRKTFHQFDARIEKQWVFDTWLIGAYLDVQNVFNVANQEAVQFDYRLVERGSVTSVPILPTLGVRGQW